MRIFRTSIAVFILMAASLAMPRAGGALTVKYLDPGYTSSIFTTLKININAFDIDAFGNLYVVDNDYWGTGTVFVDMYDSANKYAASSIYTSYTPVGNHADGITFDGLGDMFTSECTGTREGGAIHRIDPMLNTEVYYTLKDICPTDISSDASGDIYFTGRRGSDLLFGNIYRLDKDKKLKVVVPDFVGEGIAVDGYGNIFASNWRDSSLYMFDAESYTPALIATFDVTPDGVAVDVHGNVYIFENNGYGEARPTPIIRLTRVHVPSSKEPSVKAESRRGWNK